MVSAPDMAAGELNEVRSSLEVAVRSLLAGHSGYCLVVASQREADAVILVVVAEDMATVL